MHTCGVSDGSCKHSKLVLVCHGDNALDNSIFRSEAKDLVGDDWVQIHRRIVQQHANQYKRIAWAKVMFFQPYAHFKILLTSAFSFGGGA